MGDKEKYADASDNDLALLAKRYRAEVDVMRGEARQTARRRLHEVNAEQRNRKG